jgi:UDP-glucuronate 4-epimerase
MMSFSEAGKVIGIVGCGFLGKYLLTRMLDAYEEKILRNGWSLDDKRGPFAIIIDKANPDSLYKFPLLDKFENKGYTDYFWQSMGDTSTLQKRGFKNKVDDIVITGAIADVPYAMASPVDTYQTNVINTLQFMEYLRVNDFDGRIICMSSESVLGHQSHDKLPLKEDDLVPNPANVYGASKLAQEQIVMTYARSYGLNATCLRSATLYGPYGRTKQAIPIFIRQIMERKPVTLEGDGSQSRDFVFVEDTARAIELALYTKENIKGEIINVGSGKELKFLNLIHLIRHTLGMKEDEVKINYKPFRAGEEGLRVCLDISKAKKLLNYEPQYPLTGIDSSGLKTTIEWMANYVLNYDEKEMDDLRRRLYPLRYGHEEQKQEESGLGDIQVSI